MSYAGTPLGPCGLVPGVLNRRRATRSQRMGEKVLGLGFMD